VPIPTRGRGYIIQGSLAAFLSSHLASEIARGDVQRRETGGLYTIFRVLIGDHL
jgi:hypothetical protein